MKIFSLASLVLSLAAIVLGLVEGSLLQIFSGLSMTVGCVFLFLYAKNRDEKTMNFFALFLALYIVLSTFRLLTEKGYF